MQIAAFYAPLASRARRDTHLYGIERSGGLLDDALEGGKPLVRDGDLGTKTPGPCVFPLRGPHPSGLIGHQPVQLELGASAFGSDCFKCAVYVLRDARLEPTGPRGICLKGR
jgi:hypothetical protein